MGVMADSLFTVLMSWVRALVSGVWALFSQENTTILEFLGKNWIAIAVTLIAAGLVIDWLVWLVRWQPYHIWAQRVRRLLRIEIDDEEGAEEEPARARAAAASAKKHAQQDEWDEQEVYAAYEAAGAPAVDEEEERDVMARAEGVPDEELGVYPGMRYESTRESGQILRETQRYSAIASEGPGAAEVSRRREEIEAYRRMQEEAAERARKERIRRQEEERMAAQRAEQMRRQEETRMAQEAYARELAEYERKKAQYERELAEYERQKAEYEDYLARQQAAGESAAEPVDGEGHKRRTRRRRAESYGDYIAGEAVNALPDAPVWPAAEEGASAEPPAETAPAEKKRGLIDRMAKLIEEEEKEEISSLNALPPRVDRREAYRPAKTAKKADAGTAAKGAKR